MKWLQQRVEQYRSNKSDMCEAIEDFDELDKLGQGFMSDDPLEEVDTADGSIPRPAFVNANLKVNYKAKLIELLKEYVDCFALFYSEMTGLNCELVEHQLPIKEGFQLYKQPSRRFNLEIYHVKEVVN